MTVMITGGTGFVGLNVAEALLARGEHVVAVARDRVPVAARTAFSRLPGRLTEVQLEIRDEAALCTLMRETGTTRLLPFAAITSGAEREADGPEAVIEVNLLGFIGQLRAARDAGVGRIIAPASGAVYGESFYDHALLDEVTTPCRPTGIYGVTKYAVDRTAQRLAALWGLDVVVARISSVFGPWEHDTGLRDLLTPYWGLARAAVAGEEAVLPHVLPDYTWIYARDIAAGLLHLLDLGEPTERVFNICSGQSWGAALLGFADRLTQDFPEFRWRQSADPTEVNVRLTESRNRGRMDIARIAATGWAPAFGPMAAHDDYAAWLRAHPKAL